MRAAGGCAVSVACVRSEGFGLSPERLDALFPRVQEKKPIVAANFLICGSKAITWSEEAAGLSATATSRSATQGEDASMRPRGNV